MKGYISEMEWNEGKRNCEKGKKALLIWWEIIYEFSQRCKLILPHYQSHKFSLVFLFKFDMQKIIFISNLFFSSPSLMWRRMCCNTEKRSNGNWNWNVNDLFMCTPLKSTFLLAFTIFRMGRISVFKIQFLFCKGYLIEDLWLNE